MQVETKVERPLYIVIFLSLTLWLIQKIGMILRQFILPFSSITFMIFIISLFLLIMLYWGKKTNKRYLLNMFLSGIISVVSITFIVMILYVLEYIDP